VGGGVEEGVRPGPEGLQKIFGPWSGLQRCKTELRKRTWKKEAFKGDESDHGERMEEFMESLRSERTDGGRTGTGFREIAVQRQRKTTLPLKPCDFWMISIRAPNHWLAICFTTSLLRGEGGTGWEGNIRGVRDQ